VRPTSSGSGVIRSRGEAAEGGRGAAAQNGPVLPLESFTPLTDRGASPEDDEFGLPQSATEAIKSRNTDVTTYSLLNMSLGVGSWLKADMEDGWNAAIIVNRRCIATILHVCLQL